MREAIARLRSLLRGLMRGGRLGAEMDEEFRFHIEQRTAELEQAGLSPWEAVRKARLEFGSTERYREEGREARGLRWIDEAVQILRYGALKPSTGAFSSGSAPRLSGDAAFALARVVASRLYGVSPGDPAVFLAVPALVAALSIVATWRPASAGAAASPLEAVRGE